MQIALELPLFHHEVPSQRGKNSVQRKAAGPIGQSGRLRRAVEFGRALPLVVRRALPCRVVATAPVRQRPVPRTNRRVVGFSSSGQGFLTIFSRSLLSAARAGARWRLGAHGCHPLHAVQSATFGAARVPASHVSCGPTLPPLGPQSTPSTKTSTWQLPWGTCWLWAVSTDVNFLTGWRSFAAERAAGGKHKFHFCSDVRLACSFLCLPLASYSVVCNTEVQCFVSPCLASCTRGLKLDQWKETLAKARWVETTNQLWTIKIQ